MIAIAVKYRVRVLIEKEDRQTSRGEPDSITWVDIQECSMSFSSYKSSEALYANLLHLLVQEKAEKRNGKDSKTSV